MKLTLLGTGCPQCSPDRFGPANLIQANERSYLVDCGSGVTQRLMSAGSSGADLDAVFLTHLHSDHVIDLYQLIISSWHQGRDRPQRIFGPPGTRAFVDGTMAVWEEERNERIAFERRTTTAAFEIEVNEITPGTIYDDGVVSVEAVAVNHQPVTEAFGFIFHHAGRKLAFSGDTSLWPPFIRAAAGADALVHEVFLHKEVSASGGTRTAEGVRNVASYHTLSTEVGQAAHETGAGVLFLNHFVPVVFDKAALIEDVRAQYKGPIVVGEDLMRYDLSTRVLEYSGASLALDGLK